MVSVLWHSKVSHSLDTGIPVWRAGLNLCSSLSKLGKQQIMASRPGQQQCCMEFLTPGFGTVQPWLLWPLGIKGSKLSYSVPSPSLCHSNFQINKFIFLKKQKYYICRGITSCLTGLIIIYISLMHTLWLTNQECNLLSLIKTGNSQFYEHKHLAFLF